MSDPPSTALIFGVWAAIAACVMGSLFAQSALVRRMFRDHRDAWELAGRPLWILPPPRPEDVPGGITHAQLLAMHRTLFRWMFRTPSWALADPVAVRLLWAIRILQILGLAGAAAWMWIGVPQLFAR